MQKEYDFKFIDLFAGIGGFHLAMHSLGGKCVFASEINKHARITYEKNFRKVNPEIFDNNLFNNDITDININEIPDFDILCAGFPCQPFSISGYKKGFLDTRGTLFFDILKVLKHKKPQVVFLENVKHLKDHDKKRTLATITQKLEKEGYFVSWKILNSKNFGLAQNRERIIIIAGKNKEFDFSTVANTNNKVIKDIQDNESNFEILDRREYTIIPKDKWKEQKSGLVFCGYRNKKIRVNGARPNTEHLSRVHKQPNRIYHINGIHPTIPSQETSGRFWIYNEKQVRKLTINECYKLQGFPKKFIKNENIGACYNQIGNAVAVPMIKSVGQEIINQLLL